MKQRSYPNVGDGIDYDISYNDLGWATMRDTHENTTPTETTVAKFEYWFDNNGNITNQKFHHRAAGPQNDYGCDYLNRLVTVDYIDDTDEEFTYDKLGNRTGLQDLRDGTENYVVNSQTNRYNSVGGNNLTYDEAGNLTTDPNGYEYSYDYENRLIKIT